MQYVMYLFVEASQTYSMTRETQTNLTSLTLKYQLWRRRWVAGRKDPNADTGGGRDRNQNDFDETYFVKTRCCNNKAG